MSAHNNFRSPNCVYISTHPEYDESKLTSGIHIFNFNKSAVYVDVVAYAAKQNQDNDINFLFINVFISSESIINARIFEQDVNYAMLRQAAKDKNEQIILDYILPKCNLEVLVDLIKEVGIAIGRRNMGFEFQKLLGL